MRILIRCSLLVFFAMGCPAVAFAQPVSQSIALPEHDDLVEALVVRSFASRAATDARFSAELRRLIEERDAIMQARLIEAGRRARAERELEATRGELADTKTHAAELEQAILVKDAVYQQALAENTAAITEVAQRNRDFAAQIEAYRAQLLQQVTEASPEERALLWQFAEGDRVRAYSLLANLIELKNRDRLDAAQKIASELEFAARSKTDNEDRLLGILGMDLLGRHELSVAEVLKPWARIVEGGSAERADYFILATLQSLAADDVAAAATYQTGLSKGALEQARKDYPFLSFVEAAVTNSGSLFRPMADLIQTPTPPITRADIDVSIPGPTSSSPLAAELAPILKDLATCEETATAARDWKLASEFSSLAFETGDPLPSQIAAVATAGPPTVECSAAEHSLSTWLSAASQTPESDALVQSAAMLTVLLRESGEANQAAALGAGAATYCDLLARRRDLEGAYSTVGCVLLGMSEALALTSSTPERTRARLEVLLARLDRVDLRKSPSPNAVWLVPYAYHFAATLLDDAGDLPGAIRASEKAERASRLILKTWPPYPVNQLQPIEHTVNTAALQSQSSNGAKAASAFSEASKELAAFMEAHPNSQLACDLFDDLFEYRLSWFLSFDRAQTIEQANEAEPTIVRCNELDRLLSAPTLDGFPGLTSRTLIRQKLYLLVGSEVEGNRFISDGPATKAWLLLAEDARDGLRPDAPSTLVRTYMIAARRNAEIAAEHNDLPSALHWYEEFAQVSRTHFSRSSLRSALLSLADIRTRLGDREGAASAWTEASQLCAVEFLRRPQRRSENLALLIEEFDRNDFDLSCAFRKEDEVLAARASLEQELAALGNIEETQKTAETTRRIADIHFQLGTLFQAEALFEKAVTEFEQSLALRTGLPQPQGPSSEPDLTPYVMARLARLTGNKARWLALRSWLVERQAVRTLTYDEQDLLTLADEARFGM